MERLRKYSGIFRWLAAGVMLTLLLVLPLAAPAQAQSELELILDPTEGKLDDKVTVTGTGFDAGTYPYLYLYFCADKANIGDAIDGKISRYKLLERNIRPTEETDPFPGEFETAFRVPDALSDGEDIEDVHGGEYRVCITPRTSKEIIAVTTFSVSHGEIVLTPEIGTVGSEVSISGEGLRPEQRINIEYDGRQVIIKSGDIRTDGDGRFTSTITVPEGPTGDYTITALDESGNRPEAEFSIIPRIALSPTSQDIDKVVEISGTGFSIREPVIVTLDGTGIITNPVSLHTNRLGSLGGSFVVPPRPAYADGSLVRVRIRDESNNLAEAELTVLPISATINLNPTTSPDSPGHVGMELTVSGIWFVAGATINITYGDDETLPVTTTEALDSRNFSATFTVPPSLPGSHPVCASDGVNSVTAVFTMESERPLTPVPLVPGTAATIEAETHFDWEDVSDPSGITYAFQVGADSDFATIVLEKNGLADSEYTPSEEEQLRLTEKKTPYYWRVKAIDGTFNESYWTLPSSFYIGGSQEVSPPGWVKYLGIGLGSALAAFFIVRMYRRRAE